MQDRYAGDIGDYLKFALLRAVSENRRLAVCWWRHPDEGHNSDGKFTAYLRDPGKWLSLDAWLFGRLGEIVATGRRSISSIEAAALFADAFFHSEQVPIARLRKERSVARSAWFSNLRRQLAEAEVVFLDPDNGIDFHRDAGDRCSAKHVTLEEIAALGEGRRTIIVHHHQARNRGKHHEEIALIAHALNKLGIGGVTAIRAKPYSPRVFFVVGPDIDLQQSMASFAGQHPDLYEVFEFVSKASSETQPQSGWTAQILTLYPEMFPGPLGVSLAGRALNEGVWSLDTVQIRDFAIDRHKTVDDTPAGGGAGMVLRVDVLSAAVDHALARHPDCPVLAMTPRGRPLTQDRVRQLASGPGVTILCGRFEGFDERIFACRPVEEVAIGDIVLSGGEPAAIMLLDACVRLLPGVMGAADSGTDESFESGLIEYPHYTRPVEWEGLNIPDILRSGDHAKIAAWRRQRAEEDTKARRPDLWKDYSRG